MNKIYLLLGLSLALVHTSCLEDEGNYEYTDLSPVEISGLRDSYRFILQDPVHLPPSIKTDIPQDRLEYCWRVGADTLAKTVNLDYTFSRIPTSSGPLTFEVHDKLTDVRYSKNMSLSVVSPFYTGWLILADEGGKSVLNFQSYEGDKTLYHDIYKEVNGKDMTGTPVQVQQQNFQDGNTGAYQDRVVVINRGGSSPMLDGVTMLNQSFIEDQFNTAAKPSLAYVDAEYFSSLKAVNVVADNGDAYGKAVGSMASPEDGHFQFPYQGDDKGYKLAPFLVKPAYTSYLFGFDEKNHRYVYFMATNMSSVITELPWDYTASASGIDLNNIPGKPLWIGSFLYNENVYTIMKDDTDYKLYWMSVIWNGTTTMKACVTLPAGTVNDQSKFQVHPTSPYIFMSNGSKLMALNLDNISNISDAINDIATFDGDITAIHYAYANIYDDAKRVNQLAIAIRASATESSLLIIDPQLTAHGQILERYDGIKGKVVSICRKVM